MSRYHFDLASEDDAADLRHVLAATPMAGRIAMTFCREPSWFAATVVDGRWRQVVACRDLPSKRIIGFGCRSVRDVYLNGRPATVGYLSSLRLLPEHRNIGLVARGYAALRRLRADGQTPSYLTTIAEGNDTALSILTSGRAGLPAYHEAGAYHTVAIAIPRKPQPPRWGRGVRPARPEDLDSVLEFLAASGPRRQFFPRLQAVDFLSPHGAMRGLTMDDLLLAERGGRLVGTLAGWDQHGYRQSVVHAYHGWLRGVRPLYNATAWLLGRPRLPQPGGGLPLPDGCAAAGLGRRPGGVRRLAGGAAGAGRGRSLEPSPDRAA
jgi:hypothetical protein